MPFTGWQLFNYSIFNMLVRSQPLSLFEGSSRSGKSLIDEREGAWRKWMAFGVASCVRCGRMLGTPKMISALLTRMGELQRCIWGQSHAWEQNASDGVPCSKAHHRIQEHEVTQISLLTTMYHVKKLFG